MSAPDFAVPIDRRYFEDYTVGSAYEYGTIAVDETEAIAFARAFDPQPIHVDPVAAAHGPFGGLIASGWHTAAMMMRVVVDEFIDAETSLGSPGLGPIHWTRPVRPGDVLRVRARITANRRSQSKPDRGTVTIEVEVLNQKDEVVMTVENWLAIVKARPEPR